MKWSTRPSPRHARAILAKKGPQALEELRKSAEVLPIADEPLRADWNRLAQEAAKVAKTRLDTTGTVPILVQAKGPSPILIGVIAVVVLIVAGVVFFVVKSKSGAANAVPVSYMQLTASPSGEVVSITGGRQESLPPA